jgi:hypothetical protein
MMMKKGGSHSSGEEFGNSDFELRIADFALMSSSHRALADI